MRAAIYNSAIPIAIRDAAGRARRSAFFRQSAPCLLLSLALLIFSVVAAQGTDWHSPEQELARKIVAVTGPGAVALTVENRSSLGRREVEIIQNGLRVELSALGLRFVDADRASGTVAIFLSENPSSYVWVAEIRQGAGEKSVVMVSTPRVGSPVATHDAMPMTLRKTQLWTQDDPILDVAVLEESATPTYIAVLDARSVSLYRWQNGKWMREQALEIVHEKPWPRDLRGRLLAARDHLFDVYLPGVACHSTATAPLGLNCRASDDPWPVGGTALSSFAAASSGPAGTALNAFFAPARNFFTGAVAPAIGKFSAVPKFYSAAALPREKYMLWLFAATDGHIHMIDGVSDQTVPFAWGSDLASVKTNCGAGWQVLSTTPGVGGQDSVRAFEFPDRDAVAVSAPVEFDGPVSALWTEAKGDGALAVARNLETGQYEAFRLSVACNQ
jgi:hypothetical protein